MKTIQSKIIILIFFSVFISSVLIGAIGIGMTSKVVQENAQDKMNLLCQVNTEELNLVFSKVEEYVDILTNYATEELESVEALQKEEYRTLFTDSLEKSALHYAERTEGVLAIYVRYDYDLIRENDGFFFVKNDNSGSYNRAEITDLAKYTESDEEYVGWWYKAVNQKGPVWTEVYYNANIGENIISYVCPFYRDNQLLGVIGIDISEKYIGECVEDISVFETGKVAIMEKDGTVVYHSEIESGNDLDEINSEFSVIVTSMANQEYTQELITYEMQGVEKKLAARELENGMTMLCFAPTKEIYQEQYALILEICCATIFVGGLFLLISFIIGRKMTLPIRNLNEAAKHFTEGDFEVEIQKVTNDEIGELATTFLEMKNILKHQFDMLEAQAHRDGLTGMGNKSAFMKVETALNSRIQKGNANFAVAVFDVNKLKITNDVFGHMTGDKLLLRVADHLAEHFGQESVFRIGGDEFVVIVSDERTELFHAQIQQCIDDMKKIQIDGLPEIRVSCACGAAFFDRKMDLQFQDVLRNADKEMYKNKAVSKTESFPWEGGLKGLKRIQIERYCELLEKLSKSTDDVLFLLNIENREVHLFFGDNSSVSDISDILKQVHPNDRMQVQQAMRRVLYHEIDTVDMNFRFQNGDEDTHMWVNCRGNIVHDESEDNYAMIGQISENAVKHLYNPLTTLNNRVKLKNTLMDKSAVAFSYFMFINIDNFFEINLCHGSAAGDEILKSMAELLESKFQLEQLYHVEKDGFLILLENVSENDVDIVYEEVRESFENRCSVSAVVVPNDNTLYNEIGDFYEYAEIMMSNAKKKGAGQITYFSREDFLENVSEVELVDEIEKSVKHGCDGFYLVYQPQVSGDDYSVLAAEALLRFKSPSKGTVKPDQFIPILENTGMINEVGLWVLDKALEQCEVWRKMIPNFCVNVNVSPIQLKKRKNALQMIRCLEKHKMPMDALMLELTETTQLEENEDLRISLNLFEKKGIRVAIDDFGTGYSNLGYLKQLNVDAVKIDRVFVKNIQDNSYNYNLITNITDFAKKNSLRVCLEGVETVRELAVLKGLEIDILQGYLFGKPCNPREFEQKFFLQEEEKYNAYQRLCKQLKDIKRDDL